MSPVLLWIGTSGAIAISRRKTDLHIYPIA